MAPIRPRQQYLPVRPWLLKAASRNSLSWRDRQVGWKAYGEFGESSERGNVNTMGLREFVVNNGVENPTLLRRILSRAAINGTVILEDRQRTDGRNCDSREEDELQFPRA